MKKTLSIVFITLFLSFNSKAQCDLDYSFVNTGTNMTAFFTPNVASSLYNDLGDGTIGAFFIDDNGNYVCAASAIFTGAQIQLAVMADDSTSPEKDGFAANESINWFYLTTDGSSYQLSISPNDAFAINGLSFIQSASSIEVNCNSDNECPSLDLDFVNTGANMTLFITPDAASNLNSSLGQGQIAVYYNNNGTLACAGTTQFTGQSAQIAAYADDSTTGDKDGFAANESIVWKFQSNDGSQFELFPNPSDVFQLNGISLVTAFAYDAISCAVDVEGCTDAMYLEYNSAATIDDGSCETLIVYGCTDSNYLEYNAQANTDDGSCNSLMVSGCTNALYLEYNPLANTDDGSCETLILEGCTDMNATNYDSNANVNDGSCDYDLIGSNCDVSFDVINTGTNHAIFLPPSSISQLNVGDQIGVFYIADNGQAQCAGSSTWTGSNIQIAAYGDDATTPTVDGLTIGAPLLFIAQSGDDVYTLEVEFSNGPSTYITNGISFVSSANLSLACTVEYLGCTDADACNYDYSSNTDDGSCEYPQEYLDCTGSCLSDVDADGVCDQFEIIGCTDINASNYNPDATDSGICDYEGCTDAMYLEYNSAATIDDGSCETLIVYGCTDSNYLEYNAQANTDDGSCNSLMVSGCTNALYLEYNPLANTDDGSCETLILEGCTDMNATNYDSNANVNDGSCDYDLIGSNCDVSFDVINTGTNHAIFLPPSSISQLNVGDQIGVFYIADNGQAQCAGSSTWTGSNIQIAAYGDDATTPTVDGLTIGAPLLFIAQSGDDVYTLEVEFSNGPSTYITNGISFVSSANLSLACTVEYLGCTDADACNYDYSSNTDDGSCEYPQEYLDCTGSCLSDVDADGVCDQFEIYGCTNVASANYDNSATEDNGSCISWEEAYNDCLASGGDDGITQVDLDAIQLLLNEANADLALVNGVVADLQNQLDVALSNQEDGITQADIDVIQSQLNAANNNLLASELNVASLEEQLEEALVNQEDGVTQADVDAVQAELDQVNIELLAALANQEDGFTQADVDAVQVELDQVNIELLAALANQEDGVTQADVNAVQNLLNSAYADISSLELQLEEALNNSGGSGECEPIYVDFANLCRTSRRLEYYWIHFILQSRCCRYIVKYR